VQRSLESLPNVRTPGAPPSEETVIGRHGIPGAPEGKSSPAADSAVVAERGSDDWSDDDDGSESSRSARATSRGRGAVSAYAPHGVLVNAISQIVKEFSDHQVGRFVVTVRVQVGYNTTEVSVSSDDVQRTAVTG
jgi:hypothetical protein